MAKMNLSLDTISYNSLLDNELDCPEDWETAENEAINKCVETLDDADYDWYEYESERTDGYETTVRFKDEDGEDIAIAFIKGGE